MSQKSLFELSANGDEFPIIDPPTGWCFWCPTKEVTTPFVLDHIIPRSKGGTAVRRVCAGCNQLKSDDDPHLFLQKQRLSAIRMINSQLQSLLLRLEENVSVIERLPLEHLKMLRYSIQSQICKLASDLRPCFDLVMWLSRFGYSPDAYLSGMPHGPGAMQAITAGIPDQCYCSLVISHCIIRFDVSEITAVGLFVELEQPEDELTAHDLLHVMADHDYPEWLAAMSWKDKSIFTSEPGNSAKQQMEWSESRANKVCKHVSRLLEVRKVRQFFQDILTLDAFADSLLRYG